MFTQIAITHIAHSRRLILFIEKIKNKEWDRCWAIRLKGIHPTPHILFDSLDNIQYYKRAFLSLELRVWQTGLERPLLPSPQSTNGSPKFRGHMSRLSTFFFFSTRHRETELDSLYRLRSICCTAKQHTYGHMCTHSRHAQLHLWLKTFQIFFLFWREIWKKIFV